MNYLANLLSPLDWLWVALTWILVAFLWRDYRVDRLRQNLFAIRDELFDLADANELSFNDPAYGLLRSRINSSIQFAYRVNLLNLLFTRHAATDPGIKGKPIDSYGGQPHVAVAWRNQCKSLPKDVQSKLLKLERRYHSALVAQVVLTSPFVIAVIFFSICCLIPLAVWPKVKRLFRKSVDRTVTTVFMQRTLGGFELANLPKSPQC
ncbi:MAG: hypothetical protein AAF802_14780 [Planctomycetota bacterium]